MFHKFLDKQLNSSSTTACKWKPLTGFKTDQDFKVDQDWLRLVEAKPGAYTKSEKRKMCISSQTSEGLKITVDSVI